MRVALMRIEIDTSIQCRAAIDTTVVDDYAERMKAGDVFPPVVLFGRGVQLWIGDGWHRIMAAKQIGAGDILSEVREGGRAEALKHALSANAAHGHRRTNADKRRCVEIALREFEGMSNLAIANMCGVSDPFVMKIRPSVLTVRTSPEPETRTDSIGRQQPAHKPPRAAPTPPPERPDPEGHEDQAESPPPAPASKRQPVGLLLAMDAINILRRIPANDPLRDAGFREVTKWVKFNGKKG